jgi:hypothetical protein
MTGQLIMFYDGPDPEHFLKGVFEFPQVLPVISARSEELKRLADEKNRSVLFMGADEARIFFSPEFTFHYSPNGKSPEEVAVKLKQDFVVMMFFGRVFGDPIGLQKNVDGSTAAPVIVYEILKLLRGF